MFSKRRTTSYIQPVLLILLLLFVFLWTRQRYKNKAVDRVEIQQSMMTKMQDMGDLVSLTTYHNNVGVSKEADTWYKDGKKMILFCNFSIEYRFDLNKVSIENTDDSYIVKIPPCRAKVSIDSVNIYDEKDGSYPFWDRMFGIFTNAFKDKFTTEDRNRMIAAAKKSAIKTAMASETEMIKKAELNLTGTLSGLFSSLGIPKEKIMFEFAEPNVITQTDDAIQNRFKQQIEVPKN